MNESDILDPVRDPEESETVEAKASYPAHQSSQGFQAPEGYVLVEKAMYEFLLAQVQAAKTPALTEKRQAFDREIYLTVLRPMHLGDIKTQLNPGETVAWIPRKSITVRGMENHTLTSFLAIWNKQDPRSPKYDPKFPPVFAIDPECEEDLVKALGPVPNRIMTRAPETEEDRIAREERRGDAARKKANIGIENAGEIHTAPQPKISDGLPPSGSEERKALIHATSMERLNTAGRKAAGIELEQETPESFPVESRQHNQRVVATIPGLPADSGEVIDPEAGRPRARKTRR
jgi:hypothetical protein